MKINLKKYLIVLLGALVLSSCNTDKTMVAKGVNLNKYEYASLTQSRNGQGAATDIEIKPGIYDAVEATRLQMVGDRRLEDLSPEQKEKLVLLKYSTTSEAQKSVLSVSFEDYMTGKVVASSRVSSTSTFTHQAAVDKAVRKMANRIHSIWK
jgi:hypothetical protein